jgi:hypothetical protein
MYLTDFFRDALKEKDRKFLTVEKVIKLLLNREQLVKAINAQNQSSNRVFEAKSRQNQNDNKSSNRRNKSNQSSYND